MPSLRPFFRLLTGPLVPILFATLTEARASEEPAVPNAELPEIRIGYIEASFSPSERQAFAHTFLYLSVKLPQYRFTIRPYLVKDLEEAVRTKSIDFFLAASGFTAASTTGGCAIWRRSSRPRRRAPTLRSGRSFSSKRIRPTATSTT